MKKIVVEGICGSLKRDFKHVINQHRLTTLFDEVVQYLKEDGFTVLPSGVIDNSSDFDVAIYTSRRRLEDARRLKLRKPDKMVILFVGVVKKYDDADGVLPLCCSGVDVKERLMAAIAAS